MDILQCASKFVYINKSSFDNSIGMETKFETARTKLRASYKKIADEKSRKALKVVPFHVEKKSSLTCQAVTMLGKPCPFRATSSCGKFCKKHII